MNCTISDQITSTFTNKLLVWIKDNRLTIDDTNLVKEQALKLLHTAYPAYIGDFNLDIQYYTGGAYAIIPRNLITGLAICDELAVAVVPTTSNIYQGKKGTYEFNGKDLIFRPYLKPEIVYIDMSVRNSD